MGPIDRRPPFGDQQPAGRVGGQPPGQARGQPGPTAPAADPRLEAILEAIIVRGDGQALVKYAEELGETLKNRNLKTSQVRGIFGRVRSIEMNWPRGAQAGTGQEDNASKKAQRDLLLLRPKLAYQAKRIPAVEDLKKVIDPAIQMVMAQHQERRRECFQNFVDFFEAIIAYHRAYGGAE